MKVTREDSANCQVALKIEAEAGELAAALNDAYRRLVNRVVVPGFRKGKTPRTILEQHIGKENLLNEALDQLVSKLYKQAIESEKLEPIAPPEIEVVQNEPLVFRAVVSLKPEVKLGDYRGIRLNPEPVEVGEKEIAAALERIREERGVWIPVERAVKEGDLVTLDVEASVEGKQWLNHKGVVYEVSKESRFPAPDFASQLIGAEKRQEKTFTLTLPPDYPVKGIQGKESVFKVLITEIKEKQLPELNDELAQAAGYENLADMKEKVTGNLKAEAEAKARQELKRKALDAVVGISEVNYPPVLEEEEINRMLEKRAQRLGFREVTEYLKRSDRREEELREELRPAAKKSLVWDLVLEKLAEEEKIEINATEIENKISQLVESANDKEGARRMFSLPAMKETVERSLREEKTMERLLQIVQGNAEKN